MEFRRNNDRGRAVDMADPRTPMAWQHRDINYRGDGFEGRYEMYNGSRQSSTSTAPAPRYGGRATPNGSAPNSRYGGPPTPSSAHSRKTRTPDHRRRDTRGSSSERFSQHSGRKMSSRDSRDGRSNVSRGSRSNPYRGYSRSQPSPSSTEETTEETTETESQTPERNDYQRQMFPGYAVPFGYPPMQPQLVGPIAPPQLFMAPNGSIRSVHSVPMLTGPPAAAATWDGEPCPVHHQPAVPLAALYGVATPGGPALSMGPSSVISGATTVRRARSVAEISNGGFAGPPPPPPPPPSATPRLEHKSFHSSLHHLPPPRVVVAENGAPSHLPIRDPKNRSPLPPKGNGGKDQDIGCCSGHFVVIWIILGIITFGILLGIILRFTIAQ